MSNILMQYTNSYQVKNETSTIERMNEGLKWTFLTTLFWFFLRDIVYQRLKTRKTKSFVEEEKLYYNTDKHWR